MSTIEFKMCKFVKLPGDLPEDLFVHLLKFYTGREKVQAALVCRGWRDIIYIPELWPKLNLSNIP